MKKLCEENVIAKELLRDQAEVEKKKNHEKWSERQKIIDSSWDEKREMLMAAFITKEAPGVSQRCHQCGKAVTFCTIRCSTCKEVLCQDCDFNHYLTRPFHNRQCMKLDLSLPLKPTQFLDADCEMFETSMQ